VQVKLSLVIAVFTALTLFAGHHKKHLAAQKILLCLQESFIRMLYVTQLDRS